MNKTLYSIIFLVVIGFLGYLALNSNITNKEESKIQYTNDILGISFLYSSDYALEETIFATQESNLIGEIILILKEDKERMDNNPPIGGEGPPVMKIIVFKNTQKQFPVVWAESNPLHSNINLKIGEEKEGVVGGANAVSYIADGLYASDNFVVAHGENIYVIVGQFLDVASKMRLDFKDMINSLTFIPGRVL